jgi:ankyrin repeat protein
VLLYTGLSLAAHLALAYDSGFFDKWIDEYKRDARAREFPALTQLQYAVSRGPVSDIARVQAALAAGADPNAGSYSDPDTPLLVIAAARADAPTIEALLAAGANPDARAAMTYDAIETPAPLDLVLFSEYGNPIQSMELLLAAGADPAGTMLRSGACFRGDPALYRSAAGLGATDRTDGHQNTCLHLAAAQDRIALLEALLITPGSARPVVTQMLSSANHSSQYPLDTAVAAGNFGAALLLAQAGGEANQPWTLEKVMAADSGGEALANLRSLLLQRQKQAN